MHRIHRLKLEGGWLCHLLCLSLDIGGIVYAGDAASPRRLNMAFKACLRYIHSMRRLNHVSHLETSVMGASLADYARIQLLSFLYKVLHVRHPCYLFPLFRFDLSARTRNLVVPAHRSLAMSQSFVVLDGRGMRCLMA
jgi:hypothetical protein